MASNTDVLYQPYLALTAGQRKLLCFLAYTGKKTDEHMQALYRYGEEIKVDQMKKLVNSLRSFYDTSFYSYRNEYQLHAYHIAPLMLYMLDVMPQWLEHFDKFYKKYQAPQALTLLSRLECCINDKPLESRSRGTVFRDAEILVPLASDARFLPLMNELLDVYHFVGEAVVYQVKNDIADPENTIGQIASLYYSRMMLTQARDLKAIVALYDFFKQGHYDEKVTKQKGLCNNLLAGAQALYVGDYATAFNMMTAALREANKMRQSQTKGFFSRVLNNYLLVVTYYFHKPDEGRKLAALVKKNFFMQDSEHKPVTWLAEYFSNGTLPSQKTINAYLSGSAIETTSTLDKYFAMLVARFLHIDVEWPKDLPSVPNMRLLRHELSPWLPLSDEEKQQLTDDFGGEPLLSRIRYKQPWELLLEELTPHTEGNKQKEERQVRVSYIIDGYHCVEPREQTRLQSGAWGAGRRMTIERFKQGADYMDDIDRQIANTADRWDYDLDLGRILPYLIGSDRVYTGRYAPFTPVTIDEEKPYLMIERTKTAFSVKSNIGRADLNEPVVYRKDSDTHYTVITMTDRQRSYYQKLLAIGVFPLEAEEQLREFLPKVSDVVEVHSDLVEGGTTLEHRDGTPQLCLQALPQDGSPGHYSVWCLSRPLADGKTLFEAGQGLNPCVAEQDGVRYQVTRDIKGERANLELLRTFIADNDLTELDTDELFTDRTAVDMNAEGLLMLMDFVRQQAEHFYMEWPEGGQLNLKTAQPSAWNISLRSKNGWFEVEGEIPIDDETVLTVGQLLQLVAESPRGGFIRLNDTDFLALSDKLRKQLARLESLTVSNRGHLQISEFHASLLGSALSGELEIKHDKRIDQLQKKIKQSMAKQPDTPKTLKAELRDYQTDGYQWITRMTGWGAGVCLADDMGLGKTVQTIAFMLHTADQGPSLVAAPASVVLNWQRELQRFAPSLHVEVFNTAAVRKSLVEQAVAGDVILTTYGLFVTEDEVLCGKQWNTVCLDEAHVIKNRQTKTSAVVMKLQATHRIILTGTPVQNHLGELWNLFQFANPGLLGSHEQFRQKYIVPIEQQDNKERSRQLKRIVSPFMLRRTKQEVIEELPDKTEINIPVELSDDELAVYEVIRRRAKQLLEDEQSSSGVSVNTLAEITRLRQAACSAELVEKNWKGECSKLTALSDLLQEIVDGGNAVLVFSQFTSFLSMVRQQLDKQKQPYLYLDGSVPVRQRDQLVQQFQHGDCPVFLISLKAGGLGLNLTGANYVIHLDPWWNPAIEQQATDRAYRIGQRQNVTVYHLISQHTIEEKILRLHQTKRNLADAMLEGTNESHKLTSKDLLAMIDKDSY
ncbi:MAG: ATP-dependent helicase [Prevotella sp.]|nr:ATP-dependent helicase [Prevotella sp.]